MASLDAQLSRERDKINLLICQCSSDLRAPSTPACPLQRCSPDVPPVEWCHRLSA
jgi:hypothetical protein